MGLQEEMNTASTPESQLPFLLHPLKWKPSAYSPPNPWAAWSQRDEGSHGSLGECVCWALLFSTSLSFANLVHNERPDGPATEPRTGDLNKLTFCSESGDSYPLNARGHDSGYLPGAAAGHRTHSPSSKAACLSDYYPYLVLKSAKAWAWVPTQPNVAAAFPEKLPESTLAGWDWLLEKHHTQKQPIYLTNDFNITSSNTTDRI